MKNLKIRWKLLISFAVVLVLLVISILVSVVNLMNLGAQVETFYNGPFMTSASANILNERFESLQKSVYRAMANDDLGITNSAIQDAEGCNTTIDEELVIIRGHFMGDQSLIDQLEKLLSELEPMNERVMNYASNNRNAEAAAYMEDNNIPKIAEVQNVLNELIKEANTRGENLITDLRAAQAGSVVTLVILGLLSIVISMLFATYITRSITQPVAEIALAAENLSQGKLDTEVRYESQDELGQLAVSMRATMQILSSLIHDIDYLTTEIAGGNFDVRTRDEPAYVGAFLPILLSMRKMTLNLSHTLQQINLSSDQVSSGSDQVSSGSQALSQGATEQASSIEELAASINEVSGQVNLNADNAQQARTKAENVGNEMAESNQMMQQMITAMANISNSSSEIGKIIKTIEDIAFQTNILALNAAVEAARAGTAGKGFAVVADEVRSLASKSAEASKNTAVLIESSVKAVQDGTKIADATAQSMVAAVEGVGEVVQLVGTISKASQEQATAIEQITQGIDQISAVVQTNSATAEESAAASEELSGQAQLLKELVSQFNLRLTNESGAQPQSSAEPAYKPEPAQSYGAIHADKY